MTVHTERGKILKQSEEVTIETPIQDITLELLVTPKPDFILNSTEPSNCASGIVYIHDQSANHQFIHNRELMVQHFPFGPNFLEHNQSVVASGQVYVQEEGTVHFLVSKTTDKRYVILEIINNITFTLIEVVRPQDYRYLENWPNQD